MDLGEGQTYGLFKFTKSTPKIKKLTSISKVKVDFTYIDDVVKF